jgi:hypothetical protein
MKTLLFSLPICLLGFVACQKEPNEPSPEVPISYVFPDFSGKFLAQDTFYQRIVVFDSPLHTLRF